MQEEVENKTLTLVINGSKFTGRMFKDAIVRYMAHRKEVKHQKRQKRESAVTPHGKQTVKQLVEQGAGVQNIEITDKNIKSFERVARKYGVDFALKKDPAEGKYLVFFKSRDADALNAAFAEYTAKTMHRSTPKKPSLLARLSHFKEVAKQMDQDRAKNREKGEMER